jgi:acyl carrier protein
MNQDEILTKITEIMRETFNSPTLELTLEMTAKDIKGWDSLKNIWLIVAIEEAFSVKLSTSEVISIESVADYIKLIHEKSA